jgi:hypothetical protein
MECKPKIPVTQKIMIDLHLSKHSECFIHIPVEVMILCRASVLVVQVSSSDKCTLKMLFTYLQEDRDYRKVASQNMNIAG